MSARLSPGGALLRTSRMFSVPKPLPQPGGEAASVSRYLSPTATAPYPTHQSITTPESSRAIGDWGFKRSLPVQKTTKSSTPVVRIKQIDSVERITDYQSAADHTITLQKFHEMNLPISLPGPNRSRLGGLNDGFKSVFEDDGDFTTMEPGRAEEKRWKFKGPWLAGLTQGEFDRFLRKNVRNKREEFRSFLKERLATELTAAEHQKSLDRGSEMPKKVLAQDITEDQLIEYQRKLRSDRVTLYSLVSEFLDLAPLQPPSTLVNFSEAAEKAKRPSLYAENGPPMSHPSGGISYLRSAAFAENHPVYGPQAHQTPVLARIVSPRRDTNSAKLGVGGFITDVPQGDTAFNQRAFRGGKSLIPGIASFDPDIEGGAKSFVQPTSARVDSSGSVQITVGEANEEAQLIYKELVGKSKIYNDRTEPEPEAEPRRPLVRSIPWGTTKKPQNENKTFGSSKNYGLDLS
ncbi:mitochondrial 37S ribosomal protein bS1m [Colletotrichum truncatum]|uniref:Mitochondrial ribosomal protein subunit n=1 Tax=Colletotrichum truncatum TaxID=5467 RepID=A0ACC3ZK47_COLTU|nr:mitochondrial ribosomal protein subunit [Colletotrichum truncatum]KAF6799850.1 mitochondrial ribosomal protein subunit [Colletotrichum truncatum]